MDNQGPWNYSSINKKSQIVLIYEQSKPKRINDIGLNMDKENLEKLNLSQVSQYFKSYS